MLQSLSNGVGINSSIYEIGQYIKFKRHSLVLCES
jgi:hypothetical protein